MSSAALVDADLIVEDNTPLETSNAYISRADAITFLRLRPTPANVNWCEADEAVQVGSLILAADYIDVRWCFRGEKVDVDDPPQAMAWPRTLNGNTFNDSCGVDIEGVVPQQVIEANALYAALAVDSNGDLTPLIKNPNFIDENTGLIVKSKLEQVGSLRERTEWFGNSSGPLVRKWQTYSTADEMIRRAGIVVSGGGGSARGVIRA